MLLAAAARGNDVAAFAHGGMKAVWADELDVTDPKTLIRLAERAELNGSELIEIAQQSALVAAERRLTEEAVHRNLFGAPFYFYRDEGSGSSRSAPTGDREWPAGDYG